MLCALFVFPVATGVGCVHTPPEVSKQSVDVVQKRVEDVERTNGRLTVRIEELEKQLMLMEDRMEANRIALQRRGYLRADGQTYAEHEARPMAPAPESHYRDEMSDYSARPSFSQPVARRPVSRIKLSAEQSGRDDQVYVAPQNDIEIHIETSEDDDFGANEPEVVITDEDFRNYFGEPAPQASTTARAPSSAGTSSSSGTRTAQAPVTSERLPTSSELSGRAQESAPKRPDRPTSAKDQLALYQDSLAEYRAGNYAQALEGFQTFLNAGPRADYVDNALYWIGECHYGMGDFESAAGHFQKILDDLPGATKVPDAMLKMSLAYDRMGRGQDAVALLERLIEEHPSSNPGQLGVKRLADHPARQ
ncbi:MAG: tetratricopeptide repeat protein [Bradymonadaceae bacterium]